MSSGDKRPARPSRPEPAPDALDQAFSEWEEPALAAGSAPHASEHEEPAVSRAATVHDPLTTGVLAEVTRQSHTVELTPEQIAAAHNADLTGPHAAPAAPVEQRTKTPSSPHVIRRR